MAATVEHLPERGRFQTTVDGHLCVADYRLEGGVMLLTHTEVHPGLRGRGVAARLVEAALVHARANGLKVVPRCSYVRAYMRRHAQAQDLLP
jgi:predicted GNAT family acetyltransferase